MKKRLLTLIVGASMLLSCNLGASAEATSNNSITEDIKQDICVALRNVETQKSVWGLETVDFEDLFIGEPILTYEYINDVYEEGTELYPILYNDCVVLWAVEYDDTYQVTTALTDEINDYIDNQQEFTIIYDREKCYLFADETLIPLCAYGYDIEERSVLDQSSVSDELELVSFVDTVPLNYISISSYASAVYSCDVEYVAQQPNLCWAASCAAISNCINGTNYAADDVSDIYFGEGNTGSVYADDIPTVLNALGVRGYSYRVTIPSESAMVNNFIDNYPIYGSFYNNYTPDRHGCVIYGINVNPAIIYIMDPIEEYVYAYNTNGTYSYYSATAGVTWIWDQANCYRWS